jgi:tetratricopeptide (TPR) repeat protein
MAAQTRHPASPHPTSSANLALQLAGQGRCREALPLLERELPRLTDKDLLYRVAMGEARCAMAEDNTPKAVSALMLLKRRFPDDPEVLFVCVHYFSHLAMRTSQELAVKAPHSIQARRLEAEDYESQGKWDDAAGIYRGILRDDPKAPEVHYRLGQVLLNKAGDTGPTDEARAEFEKELEVNPTNASAEFILGELARRAGKFDEAARHFARAAGMDAEFSEARLALGVSLAAAGKYAEALKPLEAYVRMEPDDPVGHYQLAMVYARTGNRAGAEHELALQKEAAAKRQALPNNGGTQQRVVR